MRAVERGGGRGRREKGALSHRSGNNSPVLCPEDRHGCLLSLRVRGEEGGLTFTCRRSRTHPSPPLFFALPFNTSLSGAAEDCQPVQTKPKIRVLAGKLCLQLCYLLYHPVLLCLTHTRQNTLRGIHSENFLPCTHTYMLTSWQTGTPPPIICAGSSSAHIGVAARGCISLLSSSSSSRTGPAESSHRDHTSASTTEGKHPLFSLFFFSLSLSPLFLS